MQTPDPRPALRPVPAPPADPRGSFEARLRRLESATAALRASAARWRRLALGLACALTAFAFGSGRRAAGGAASAPAATVPAATLPAATLPAARNASFDYVTTRGLTVLGPDGKPVIQLDSHGAGGVIYLETPDGGNSLTLIADKGGSTLGLRQGGANQVRLSTGPDHGRLMLNDAKNEDVFHAPLKEE